MRILLSILFLIHSFLIFAQPAERKMTPAQYIENFKDDAIKEMLAYRVPASIILAQGMLESGNGNSALAVYANNHFGIKCHKEWNGATFIQDDDAKDECFRKYETVLESYSDHSAFLKSRPRYSFLFELRTTDYKGWAKGLKEAGYATDPRYTERLLELIETYKLFQFDKVDELPSISNKTDEKKKPETLKIRDSREILRFRSIKYVIVKADDTFSKIAKETDKDLWQLYKYNDLTEKDQLETGQRLYLQPKRNRAKEPFHIVKRGDTMKSISQLYGIKLKKLYKKNKLKTGEEPEMGAKIYLRKNKP